VQAGPGHRRPMARPGLGACCLRALHERARCGCFSIAGAIGNLSYWALPVFGGWGAGVLLGGGVELLEEPGGRMVGAVFVALLMSLCNPRFSRDRQYALLSGV